MSLFAFDFSFLVFILSNGACNTDHADDDDDDDDDNDDDDHDDDDDDRCRPGASLAHDFRCNRLDTQGVRICESCIVSARSVRHGAFIRLLSFVDSI